jgi:hypothetical protein
LHSVAKALDFSGELRSELNRSLLEAEARLSVAEKRIGRLEQRADQWGEDVAAEVRFRMRDPDGNEPTGHRLN